MEQKMGHVAREGSFFEYFDQEKMGRGGVIPSKRPLSLGQNTQIPRLQAEIRRGRGEIFDVRILLESVKPVGRFGKALRSLGESGRSWDGVTLNPRRSDSEPPSR